MNTNQEITDECIIKVGKNGPYIVSGKIPIMEYVELILEDVEKLCASARFCHRSGDIWEQIPISDNPEIKKMPSGIHAIVLQVVFYSGIN